MAYVTEVKKESPFFGKILLGDVLLSVNGEKIRDFLDYMYQTSFGTREVTVCRNGNELRFTADPPAEDAGLEFDTYLMDKERSCKNKCIFCFIDQLPAQMRKTMYYKDDDFRLSLLYGNYVTMTNMTEDDVERIIKMHVSPFNVSVHTTNPQLRVKMMKNPGAARCMEILTRFRDAGINLRGQIVLCPDWNDGKELDRTLADLKTLYPQLSSVSVVPVGLTKFRDGLEPLRTFTPQECAAVARQIDAVGDQCVKEFGTRLFYVADEIYMKAGLPVPDASYYEEFEQLENGVGMIASFRRDLKESLEWMDEDFTRPVRVSMATGKITETFFREVLSAVSARFTDLQCDVYGIVNDFFGHEITVTGLVTGGDLIRQLKGKNLGDHLLIPRSMLRDDRFLDDVSVEDAERALGVNVIVTEPDADGFLEGLKQAARA